MNNKEGISIFNNKYDDGHDHEYNKDGYCLLCGINRSQIETIEINLNDTIETSLETLLKAYGWKDGYLIEQVRAIIFEINKGVKDHFKFFPDPSYIEEKIRKLKSRISENQKDAHNQNKTRSDL